MRYMYLSKTYGEGPQERPETIHWHCKCLALTFSVLCRGVYPPWAYEVTPFPYSGVKWSGCDAHYNYIRKMHEQIGPNSMETSQTQPHTENISDYFPWPFQYIALELLDCLALASVSDRRVRQHVSLSLSVSLTFCIFLSLSLFFALSATTDFVLLPTSLWIFFTTFFFISIVSPCV